MKRTLLLILGIGLVVAGPAVVLTATLITFILPESFASTARLRVMPPGVAAVGKSTNAIAADRFMRTEVELLASEIVLTNVIDALDLEEEWGKRYAGGMTLRRDECLAILRGRIEARHFLGGNILEVVAYSESPVEATDLANGVAAAYMRCVAALAVSEGTVPRAALIQSATPASKRARLKPLNILLGAGAGLVVMMLGSGLILVAVRNRAQPGSRMP